MRTYRVPMVMVITAPDTMSEAQLIDAVWEDIRDDGFATHSSEGWSLKTLPIKKRDVSRAIKGE